MTTDLYASPTDPAPGERARFLAGWAGRAGILAVLVGTVVLLAAGDSRGRWDVGLATVFTGVVLGTGCLVHGARNEHERGRGFAIVAVCLGVVVAGVAMWGGVLPGPGRGSGIVR